MATSYLSARCRKLITELAWRDYWQRVYARIGNGIWQDREPYKTGYVRQIMSTPCPPISKTGRRHSRVWMRL
jgi:deoxyribodipyrimidine photo-lyase